MTDTVRLVLADDHEVTRTGFASLLAGHPEFEVVGQAADGQQAIDLCLNCNRTSPYSTFVCRCSTGWALRGFSNSACRG